MQGDQQENWLQMNFPVGYLIFETITWMCIRRNFTIFYKMKDLHYYFSFSKFWKPFSKALIQNA